MRKSEWLLSRPENHNSNSRSNLYYNCANKRPTRLINDVEEINNKNKRNIQTPKTTGETLMMKNTKLDLFWIIPEIIGEFFINLIIPIILISQLENYKAFSDQWLIIIGLSLLLLMHYEAKGIKEFFKIQWNKKKK